MYRNGENEMDRSDALQGLLREIGDGMEPPAALVKAAKSGVYISPAKAGNHVWKFAQAVVCYALGIALFLGAILWLPTLWEGSQPVAGTNAPSETTALTDGTDFAVLPEDLRAEVEAAYVKALNLTSFPGWSEAGGDVYYCGTHNDCVVVFRHSYSVLSVNGETEIAGYTFSNYSWERIHVYKDGELRTLTDAYEDGWLSNADIGRIHQRHLEITGQVYEQQLKKEMIAAYAKRFGANAEKLSVRIVAEYGDVCAVWIDNEGGGGYLSVIVNETVFGLTFSYNNSHTMLIYKRGDAFYTFREAYRDGVIAKENVRDLYCTYYVDRLSKKEKIYCTATLEDEFSDHEIILTVFPEFTEYPYTAEDFAEVGCMEVYVGESVVITLTLDEASKQNVLDCIDLLEKRPDIEGAAPNYIVMPNDQ